jgi:hypothetical protein
MGRIHSGMATVPAAAPEKGTHEIDYVRWLQQMQTDLAETLGGVMLRGARPVQVLTTTGGTARPLSSPGRLVGWSMRETSGAASAVIRLYDGRDNTAPLVASFSLSQGSDKQAWFAPGGISLQEGLFVEAVAGGGLSQAVEGAVFLGAAE